jgi:hypothetical protein
MSNNAKLTELTVMGYKLFVGMIDNPGKVESSIVDTPCSLPLLLELLETAGIFNHLKITISISCRRTMKNNRRRE